jgi:DNA-binding MarR family transcriptional regulator
MPRRSTQIATDDRTPQARLTEAGLHGVIGYQLAQASIVTTQVFNGAVGTKSRVRPVEYTMLALIQANPDVTARQLARGLAVTPPNIAVWIERLQSRGLVLRSRSATDARLQHIRVSTAGAKLVREATKRLLDGEAAALASLSAAERAMLVELLHKVAIARKRAVSISGEPN